MKLRIFAALIALVLLAIFTVRAFRGHDDSKPAIPPVAIDSPDNGIIRGKVIFSGTPPELHPFQGKCCDQVRIFPDESFVLAADKSLRDVVVYLKDAPAAAPGNASTVIVIDQKNCTYVPHVAALEIGQTLRFTNSDPTFHNVDGQTDDNPRFNISMSTGDPASDVVLNKPEVFQVRCDVHAWMFAWIHVMNHPYFAVTQADGTFEIHNVPPGNYTLAASHDRVGDLEQAVSVQARKSATVNFEYKTPQDK